MCETTINYPLIFTCSTANIITNNVTMSAHTAIAIDVMAVVVDVKRTKSPFVPLASPLPLLVPSPPSPPPLDLPPIPVKTSEISSPICCSAPAAIRRLPAGDAFIQPPELRWEKKRAERTQTIKLRLEKGDAVK